MKNATTKRRFHSKKPRLYVPKRIKVIQISVIAVAVLLVIRLGSIQIGQNGFYEALASGQRGLYQELFPDRGDIYVVDQDGSEIAVATNRYLYLIWADPRRVDDPLRTARVLEEILEDEKEIDDVDELLLEADLENGEELHQESFLDELIFKLSKSDDPYEPIKSKVSDSIVQEVERANLEGIYTQREKFRYYPEGAVFSHVTGFVSADNDGLFSGKYGVEGYNNDTLAGSGGYTFSERDTRGRWIGIGTRNVDPAQNGADIILTIDRTVQYVACTMLEEAVEKYDADSASLVILNPKTGAIRAMCGVPNFDPNTYNEVESIDVYNNQSIFQAYEPGSVFKPLVMAGAIDVGAVSPSTIYEDKGEEKIDVYTIRNSDLKSYGWQTMSEVLEKSLNTGMIFVMREMGGKQMARYLRDFGFGEITGIAMDSEVRGDVSALDRESEIYYATTSYGQGVTATLIQIASAYGAIANNGRLIQPHAIDEIRLSNGEIHKNVSEERQIISSKSAQILSAMLVSVIENGHASSAAIDGYYIAGKTGTAQVARENGAGYKKDETIATFAGFGPVSNPRFVAVVRIDHPRTTPWAAGTAAPVFGEIAQFLLQYDRVPPER
jgi:cell division protein FtsI/penicillin-binding protein 2